METNPQCILHTLMNCCLHCMISFNVGRKCRFCDGNATLDAGICFAAMVTKSRRRREQEQAWKHEQGNFRWSALLKTNRMEPLSADTYCTRCARLWHVWHYTKNVCLSAPALRVCFPFSGICHSDAETQQAHCLLLNVLHFKARVNI